MERWFWGDGGELCFSSALFGSGCNYMAPPSVLINAPLQRQRCYRPRQSKTKHYQQCPALREDGWLCTIDTHLKWLFAFQILQQHCTHFQMSKQLGIKEYKFFFFLKANILSEQKVCSNIILLSCAIPWCLIILQALPEFQSEAARAAQQQAVPRS